MHGAHDERSLIHDAVGDDAAVVRSVRMHADVDDELALSLHEVATVVVAVVAVAARARRASCSCTAARVRVAAVAEAAAVAVAVADDPTLAVAATKGT